MHETFFRGRRLRSGTAMRELVKETRLHGGHLVMPYFVVESDDPNFCKPIKSMPGQSQFSVQSLLKHLAAPVEAGLSACLLFGLPAHKDSFGSSAAPNSGAPNSGIVQQAIKAIKSAWPHLLVITDVCLCEYTSHGHCGILDGETVLNDKTLEILSAVAISHAKAGADMVAPSAMMDGCIWHMRRAMDEQGFENIPIMSYSSKYASSFYGPFREAAQSAPSFGNRRTYQMDPANAREALEEAKADINEGADIVMVKPAGPYLDVLALLRKNIDAPIAAYQVSGEYSMLMAAIGNGWLSPDTILESLLGIKRAGADIIISYFTEALLVNKKIPV